MTVKFDHIALRCKNIQSMADFFIDVIGLKKGFRPPFAFPGFWLYPPNSDEALMHIFGQNAQFNQSSKRSSPDANNLLDHLAFSRENYPEFINHLNKLKLSFDESFVPNTNTKQVFVKGPENLIIEVDIVV